MDFNFWDNATKTGSYKKENTHLVIRRRDVSRRLFSSGSYRKKNRMSSSESTIYQKTKFISGKIEPDKTVIFSSGCTLLWNQICSQWTGCSRNFDFIMLIVFPFSKPHKQ